MLKEHLRDYLPDYYTGDNIKDLLNNQETQIKGAEDDQQTTIAGMQPSTVTERDIERWEEEYDIYGGGLDIEVRRANLIAKIQSGIVTLTKKVIKDLGMLYTGRNIAIREYPDEFRLSLSYPDDYGEADNEDAFLAVMWDAIGAHATLELLYHWREWRWLDGQRTWGDVYDVTWDEIRADYWED